MIEINSICPVVGKNYADNEDNKFKCIYQLEGNINYPFVFLHLNDYEDECATICFSNSGRSVGGRYLVREIGPYDDFKIDDPVMVRDSILHSWRRRYFAGTAEDGTALTWEGGQTKWSSSNRNNLIPWEECRKPTKEELEG